MVTCGAKQLFQTVVGPRQIGQVITVEQPRPMALGNFDKMAHRGRERPGFPSLTMDGSKEPPIAPPNGRTSVWLGIVEDVRRQMDDVEPSSYQAP